MTRLDASAHLRTGDAIAVTIDTELDEIEAWAAQVAPRGGPIAVVFDLADGSGRAVVPSDNISHLIVFRPEPEPATPPPWPTSYRPGELPNRFADARQTYYDRVAQAVGPSDDPDDVHNHWGFNHQHQGGHEPHTHSLAGEPEQSTMRPSPE